jgi:hypothetical protein
MFHNSSTFSAVIIITQYFQHNLSHLTTGLEMPVGLQDVAAPRISGQSAHESVKVPNLGHRLTLPPRDIANTHFVRPWVDSRAILRPELLGQQKIPMNPPGSDLSSSAVTQPTAAPPVLLTQTQIYNTVKSCRFQSQWNIITLLQRTRNKFFIHAWLR